MTKLAFALDVPNITEAAHWVAELEGEVDFFKVGLELFAAEGRWPATKTPIILDLKLHDIPETVERAVRAASRRGARYVTIHIQQREALERASRAAQETGTELLGVTLLTSMGVGDLNDLDVGRPDWMPAKVVRRRVEHGLACGLRGFVCSPLEVATLRQIHPTLTLLVPGVRRAGEGQQDQKRTGTPEQVAADGASIAVVGRPIRDAANPVSVARAFRSIMSRPGE